jgi:hypothetical protein
MSLASTLLRRVTRRVWVRVMERAGKLVGRWVDTSADAPDARFAPKRDVYRTMNAPDRESGT